MLKGYVISDIHFGSMNSKKLYTELYNIFIKRIVKTKELDLVVIAGDLLDHKLSFNSEDSKNCINFINKLSQLAIKKNFAIRIIKGTKNHDLNQLNNFLYFEKKNNLNFRIINTVTEEEFKGYKILYVPEEYIEDSKEYYNEYFSKKDYYDISFVHGTFNHVEFVSKTIQSEKPILDAPIFSYKQFSNIVKGPVLCGHIHIAQSYKKKIYYTGSFSRWKYGEEKKKGFLSFELDENSSKYKVKFITNNLAPEYVTKDITDFGSLEEKEIEKTIKKVEKWKKENSIDHLRLNITNTNEFTVNSNILKKYFSENKEENIKVCVKNLNTNEKSEEEDELEKKYDFIFQNKYPIAKIISKYLKIHNNITLNESTIDDLLNDE